MSPCFGSVSDPSGFANCLSCSGDKSEGLAAPGEARHRLLRSPGPPRLWGRPAWYRLSLDLRRPSVLANLFDDSSSSCQPSCPQRLSPWRPQLSCPQQLSPGVRSFLVAAAFALASAAFLSAAAFALASGRFLVRSSFPLGIPAAFLSEAALPWRPQPSCPQRPLPWRPQLSCPQQPLPYQQQKMASLVALAALLNGWQVQVHGINLHHTNHRADQRETIRDARGSIRVGSEESEILERRTHGSIEFSLLLAAGTISSGGKSSSGALPFLNHWPRVGVPAFPPQASPLDCSPRSHPSSTRRPIERLESGCDLAASRVSSACWFLKFASIAAEFFRVQEPSKLEIERDPLFGDSRRDGIAPAPVSSCNLLWNATRAS